ncbi:hypothetical protein BGW38_001102 [Lunasporangiospora selenospora]|uniref:Uncharacterized protein n=1 Tax=Lunasporangiospora selenospora TaxID=979761 RepID=A0A9P6FU78_9FUNG|nr:hypothetical protein BGW38_001102 [Lunasporangiospora selenospora]
MFPIHRFASSATAASLSFCRPSSATSIPFHQARFVLSSLRPQPQPQQQSVTGLLRFYATSKRKPTSATSAPKKNTNARSEAPVARAATPKGSSSVASQISSKNTTARAAISGNASRQLAEMCAKGDVIMYEPPENLRKTFLLAYATAGLQMVFWCNVAQYAFTHYTDNPLFSTTQPPPPPLPLPGTEGIESKELPLAPLHKRVIISVGLIGTGLVIAFGICAIPWRYVTKLTMLQGGTRIMIETGRKFPKGYHRVYPIQNMQCRQQLMTGVGPRGLSPVKEGSSTHIMLGSKKERMAFFVDRRGSFKDASLWDKLFYRPYV